MHKVKGVRLAIERTHVSDVFDTPHEQNIHQKVICSDIIPQQTNLTEIIISEL